MAAENITANWIVKKFRDKYRLHPRSPELLQYTREEMYVDYLEDLIEEHGGPENVVLNVGTKDEPIPVRPLGVEMAKADERLIRGQSDDPFEGLPAETVAEIKADMARNKKKHAAPIQEPVVEEFSDDYTKE